MKFLMSFPANPSVVPDHRWRHNVDDMTGRNGIPPPMTRCSIFLLIAVLVIPSASAADRWYQVEVIVFRHLNTALAGREQWLDLKSHPDFRDAVELFVEEPRPQDETGNEVARVEPIAFQSLPKDALKLAEIVTRFRDLSEYEPVSHVGWWQPASGQNGARKVYITDQPGSVGDASPNVLDVPAGALDSRPRIDGTIRVLIGQLLYVTVDFVSYGGAGPGRSTERRKVRLKELHYFDHPHFGVIIEMTPYRLAEPHPEDGLESIDAD